MSKKIQNIIAGLLSIAVIITSVVFATRICTPKRHDYGSTWGHFLQEDKNSIDVLYFGTSKSYCNIAPATVWEESGITSYGLAGATQTMPVSYYSLCEALKTQTPKAIFVEVSSMIYPKFTDYTLINIGYMPMGANKLKAIFTDAEKENIPSLLFPLRTYHSRWCGLEKEDLTIGIKGYDRDMLAGYTYLNSAEPQEKDTLWKLDPSETDYDRNLEYLQKIADLCSEKNIKCVFYITDSKAMFEESFWNRMVSDVSSVKNAIWVDFNEYDKEIGIDDANDYYDFMHFNVWGAQKFSAFLADWMQKNLGLTASDTDDTELWQQRVDNMHELLKGK